MQGGTLPNFFLRSEAGQREAALEIPFFYMEEATSFFSTPNKNACGCQSKNMGDLCKKVKGGPLVNLFLRSEAGQRVATLETRFLDIKEAT